jgi:membrane-associated phospholipid phosphatase
VRDWLADEDGKLRRGPYAIALACLYAVFVVTYVPVNVFSVGRPAYTLFLPGEARLPFLPVFEYLYLLTFFLPALVIVTVWDYERFLRLARAFVVVLVVGYTTYLAFPVYLARPQLVVDSLHTWLLSLQYLDKPYNHLPSMHVALSWLSVFASQGSRASRVGLAIVAIGISVSTVFVKQHYIVDVLAGFALAWFAWRLARRGGQAPQRNGQGDRLRKEMLVKSNSEMAPTGPTTTTVAE